MFVALDLSELILEMSASQCRNLEEHAIHPLGGLSVLRLLAV